MNAPTERNEPDDLEHWLRQGREPERPCSPYAVPDDTAVLILCYAEHSEPWDRFDGRGFAVVHAPMRDDTITLEPSTLVMAKAAALTAYGAMDHGEKVLITCHQGFNRSGLVSALALMWLHDWSGPVSLSFVRKARPGSLYNPAFAAYLESLR